MKELGFFMNSNGDIIYYGEWKEQYDKRNRHEIHSSSFEDEVETDERFKRLNLQYDSEMGLYGKAIAFALQGMVLMQNLTSRGESGFIMHTPQNLTDAQKESFANLYPLLSSFKNTIIVMPKSIYINEDDKITNVDIYYEIHGIAKQKSKGR